MHADFSDAAREICLYFQTVDRASNSLRPLAREIGMVRHLPASA
jgi:hypothetical protein